MKNKNILVVGTGTIGEPLIGLLADFKKQLGIDVWFHKRTPLIDEIAKVNSLIERGAKLVVNENQINEFKKLGHKPISNFDPVLDNSAVVIDCTPAGNENKEKCYSKKSKTVFIAQGSEKGFGMPYAYGINDTALAERDPNFIQVVSCNTHNIACLLKTLSPNMSDLIHGDFVCIRRANDISQEESFIASPKVDIHKDNTFGTHHAKDAYDLFRTLEKIPSIFSSALKINSQYMHVIRFSIDIKGTHTKKKLIDQFYENKFIALTEKTLSNKIFSFGRDHGYYGRIFNQTVISTPSLNTISCGGKTNISGFCFTPQDGNSLLSSTAAMLYSIYKEDYIEYMKMFDKYLFSLI